MPVLPTTAHSPAEHSLTLGRALGKFAIPDSMLRLQPSTYMRLREWREDKINLIGPHNPYHSACARGKGAGEASTWNRSGANPLGHGRASSRTRILAQVFGVACE